MKIWKYSVISAVAMAISLSATTAQTLSPEMLQQAAALGYSESEVRAQMAAQQGAAPSTTTATRSSGDQELRKSPRIDGAGQPTIASPSTFGQSLFRNSNVSFEPSINIPTPTDYILTSGDEVVITIWGDTELLYKEMISPEGVINVPNCGPINLSGKSVDEAQKHLTQRLSKAYNSLGSTSQLSFSVSKIRSIKVNVSGEVSNPGTYTVPSLANLLHVLHISGGTKSIGNVRNIELYRDSELVTTLDIYKYILDGDATGSSILKDGDIVVVKPFEVRVSAEGEIKRPMLYQLKEGETLSELLYYVGGFNDNAYKKEITIYRNNGKDREVITVNQENFASIELIDGDRVLVKAVNNEYKNIVSISGALWRGGDFQFDEQTSSLKDLIDKAGGLKGDAFASRGVITRRNPDYTTTMINFVTADVASGAANIDLQNYDKVFIPTIDDLKETYSVNIAGEVNSPKRLNFHKGMRIEDAIILAGGLKESASLASLDVTRRVNDKNALEYSSEIAETFNFQINEDLSLNQSTADFILEPFDVIVVRRSPQYDDQTKVFIMGEVLFPGRHSITNKQTYLSDVIGMAKGTTPDAYISGASLTRRSNIRRDGSDLNNNNTYFTSDDVANLALEKLAESTSSRDTLDISAKDFRLYSVGIDLNKAMKNPRGEDDILLQEGDIILIPKMVNIVNTIGAVYYPNATSFSTKKLKHYIGESGGYNKSAVKRPFVIYPNGKVATTKGLFRRKPTIEPGAIIVIPAKVARTRASMAETISAVSSLASVASSISTLGVAIGSM